MQEPEGNASPGLSYFSLSNALDDRPTDLPHLVRRVADEMDRRTIGAMEIFDVTISSEMTADGPWWAASVYWLPVSRAPE